MDEDNYCISGIMKGKMKMKNASKIGAMLLFVVTMSCLPFIRTEAQGYTDYHMCIQAPSVLQEDNYLDAIDEQSNINVTNIDEEQKLHMFDVTDDRNMDDDCVGGSTDTYSESLLMSDESDNIDVINDSVDEDLEQIGGDVIIQTPVFDDIWVSASSEPSIVYDETKGWYPYNSFTYSVSIGSYSFEQSHNNLRLQISLPEELSFLDINLGDSVSTKTIEIGDLSSTTTYYSTIQIYNYAQYKSSFPIQLDIWDDANSKQITCFVSAERRDPARPLNELQISAPLFDMGKQTVFYVDNIAYERPNGLLYLTIDQNDSAIHSVYCVTEGKRSATSNFCFANLVEQMLQLVPDGTDSFTSAKGVLTAIDPFEGSGLSNSGLTLDSQTTYSIDDDFSDYAKAIDLIGKKVIVTLKNGKVCAIIEDPDSESEGQHSQNIVYHKEKKVLTKKERLEFEAEEFNDAVSGYYKSLSDAAKQASKKKTANVSKGSKLRQMDEQRGGDKILTLEMAPNDVINAAYEGLAALFDGYTMEGVDLGKINLSDDLVSIDAKLVNKIRNSIHSPSLYRQFGKYYVEIRLTEIWGRYTGSITVTGKGRIYSGIVNSGADETAELMEEYINNLSGLNKDVANQMLYSLITEFDHVTGISNFSRSHLEEFLKNKVSILQSSGFGKNALKYSLMIYDDCEIAGGLISEFKSGGDSEVYKNATRVYDALQDKDYSDNSVTNRIVGAAVNRLEKKRVDFEKALFDYIYDGNTSDDSTPFSWGALKALSINCPVDFEIKTPEGTRIGAYNGEKLYFDKDKVLIEIIGDKKRVYVKDGVAFNISFFAIDDGYMDYTIEQYDSGRIIGRINYYDIDLEDGKEYTQSVSVDQISGSLSQFPIYDEEGNSITADVYYSVTDDATVNVALDSSNGGFTAGEGIYIKGDTITVSAFSDDGYVLEGWYEGDVLVSKNSIYKFTAKNDVQLKAVFIESNIDANAYRFVTLGNFDDYGGAFVYKNRQMPGKIDIALKVAGTDDVSRFTNITLKCYEDAILSSESVVQTSNNDDGVIWIKGLDVGQYSTVELFDKKDCRIGVLVFVGNNAIQNLVVAENMTLNTDVVCDNLEIQNNCVLNLNGHSLLVIGNVTSGIYSSSTIETSGGIMRVLKNAELPSTDIDIYGSMIVYGNLTCNWGTISMTHNGDYLMVCGDISGKGNDEGTLSAGTVRLEGNVDGIVFGGTNKEIIAGERQQLLSYVHFNEMELVNKDIVIEGSFGANKLLSDGEVVTVEQSGSKCRFYITDLNGHTFSVVGDVESNGDIGLNGGTLNISGNLIGYRYSYPVLNLGGGTCNISGDFIDTELVMKNERDLISIGGDFSPISYLWYRDETIYGDLNKYDAERAYSAGKMHLMGNILVDRGADTVIFDGTSELYLDGKSVQTIGRSIQFNKVSSKSGIEIVTSYNGDTTRVLAIGELMSDLSVSVSSEDISYFILESPIYGKNNNSSMVLSGHELNIDNKNLSNTLLGCYIDLAGGRLHFTGSVNEFRGYIAVNNGSFIVDEDLFLGDSVWGYMIPENISNDGLLIMQNDTDIVEVHGKLCSDYSDEHSVVSYKGVRYSDYPFEDGEEAAISGGTIYLYGDIEVRPGKYEYDKIMDENDDGSSQYRFMFTGSNKVVFCGNKQQSINLFSHVSNSSFCEVEFVNKDFVISGSVSLGKILSDIEINSSNDSVMLGDMDLNGHNVTINCNSALFGNINVHGGKLTVNGDVDHRNNGKIHINRGQFHVTGSYNTDTSGGYTGSRKDWKEALLIMNNHSDVVDIDGDFQIQYTDEDNTYLNAGLFYAGGDVNVNFGAKKDTTTISPDCFVLDGDDKQRVWITSRNGVIDTLKISKPMENYSFSPKPCWNTLLGMDDKIPDIPEDIDISPTGVSFKQTMVTIGVGEKTTLKYVLQPLDATITDVFWKSSDSTCATVKNGVVTGLSVGEAIVTVTTADGKISAECHIVVKDKSSGNNNGYVATVAVKEKQDLSGYFIEQYGKYSVDDKTKASISKNGILTAKKPGIVKISGYIKNGKTWDEAETIEVQIVKPSFNTKNITATYSGQTFLLYNYLEDHEEISPTKVTSSNTKVAEIENSLKNTQIRVNGKGSSKITVFYGEGKNAAKYTITLKANIPAMSKTKLKLQTGQTSKLKLNNTKLIPSWTSGSLVTVDNTGKITALYAGEETVTASVDGIPYTCKVTIVPPSIKKNDITVKVGKIGTVGLKNTKLKNIEWESDDTSIATVDEKGRVKGISKGTTTIRTFAGNVENSCTVTVK